MSLNEEKDPRVLLKTFKRELKGWEHEFASVNKRKPTKRDIANENEIGGVFSDLALKYKAYAKLKAYVEELGDNAGEQGTDEDSFEKLDSVTRPLTIVKSDSSPEEMREETLKSEKAPSRKRFEVGTAPVSKENIGNHQDIFAKRFAEQNVIRSPNIDPSPSPQATVGPASPSSFLNEKRNYLESKPIIQPSLQVYEFNQRKQELEIITSAPRKLDFGPTFVPSSPVLPISSVSPTSYQYADKVITGEAVVASVGIPDAPSPSHANLSPVHSISAQLQCDEPKIIAVGNLDNQNISEGEDKRAVKGPPPPLPARKLSIAPDIQNSITGEESDNVVGMVVEEVDEVSQPAENVVVKTNPPNELGLPVKNLPSLIVTNLFRYSFSDPVELIKAEC